MVYRNRKTTLVDVISEYEFLGQDSAVNLSCGCPCIVIQGRNWSKQPDGVEDSIVFIDEGNRFVSSEDFAQVVKKFELLSNSYKENTL